MIVDEFDTSSVAHIATIATLLLQLLLYTRNVGTLWKNDTHRGVIERRLGYRTVNVSKKH